MASRLFPRSLISSWTDEPIPGLSLSAGGLLALADLNTIAQRTALAGGSSWLDALVLAPGLHYQQAADALDREFLPGWTPEPSAVEVRGGEAQGEADRFVVVNRATLYYLKKLCKQGEITVVTLNVALDKLEEGMGRRLSGLLTGKRRKKAKLDLVPPDMDWMSHILYLASPLLTVAAIVFMVLFEDWWGVAFILALMLSRILNIWSIKQRTKPAILHSSQQQQPPHQQSSIDNRLAEWSIDLGLGRVVLLRGLSSDLQAVTTQAWLRTKTNLDGYFEAASKLIVYLVATFSGNLTQAGAMVFMALLIVSAGLLGLSNAHATEFRTHGRLARPQVQRPGAVPRGLDAANGAEAGYQSGNPGN